MDDYRSRLTTILDDIEWSGGADRGEGEWVTE